MTRRNAAFFWLAAALLALLPVGGPAAAYDDTPAAAYRPGELIVRLRPKVDPAKFAARAGLRLRQEGDGQLSDLPIYLFDIVDGLSPVAKTRAVASYDAVIYAEPNYLGLVPEAVRRPSWVVGSDEGGYAEQWAAARISLPEAHAVSTGAGVTVAILDTGVDMAHPALAGRLMPGYDYIDGDDTPQEADASPDAGAYGHGTHVAGLVALVAPGARIMPLRTLDESGAGDLWTQAQALRYAAEHGASVINLSFSFGARSQLFDDVVEEVSCSARGFAGCRSRRLQGAVVVAAAGNSGARAREWPGASSVPGIVGVAASTEEDELADFSTYGAQIALAAPGEYVVSSVPGGGYAAWSGTSMATPLVSGAAALVRAGHTTMRPRDVIRQLVECNDEIDGAVDGRLNAAFALSDDCDP